MNLIKLKYYVSDLLLENMTCEALVIGSVAGLALTAGVLSFQVLVDRKAAQKEGRRKVAASGIVTKLAQ